MQALILVGGFGTRLRSVLGPEVPKPMAPIKDKPFLAYLLTYLKSQGMDHIIFSTHFQAESIQAYFQHHYQGMTIDYIHETTPLGTGGAIVNAFTSGARQAGPLFVLNGDTFVKFDYQQLYNKHLHLQPALSMVLKQMQDCSRYGRVLAEQGKVVGFSEKGEQGPGFINAGVYLMGPELFANHTLPSVFSFEKDFLMPTISILKPQAFITDDYFIDIGIPEDYTRAKQTLRELA